MKRKAQGHYCRICGQIKANEKFSGRGHASHICKACAKRGKTPSEMVVNPPVFIDADDADKYSFITTEDIDSYLVAVNDDPQKPQKKKRKPNNDKLLGSTQKKMAKSLLIELLANGEVNKTLILEAAVKAAIPTKALHRAKASLGIRAFVTESGNVWRLPIQKKQGNDKGTGSATENQKI